ncbi:unnamed protein product [Clonostachys chloroleuca]|uniref:Uncharacterized protein n=1 Tax=Clonostachys chloroleuca TaxID=1926264 RepID=A0AA35M9Z5_9HYPO|nr:unnamed protein product [Clonostachys chloroleuca]
MSELQFPFTFAADPNTDLWKKPPSHDAKNAHQKAPVRPLSKAHLAQFQSASVSFTCPYTVQFDQAGLVLRLSHAASSATKWIKAGVEFFNGVPRLSVVCCDNYSDWSVTTLPDANGDVVAGRKSITVRVERDGVTLWVYWINGDEKVALREIAWVYGPDGAGEGWELEIGALVARPNPEAKDQLVATFQNLEVAWAKQ